MAAEEKVDERWAEFAEGIGKLAREYGLLGIIVAGFEPVDERGMEIHLSVMNSPDLCEHEKMGMRLKTIEKLAISAFEKSHAHAGHDHDHDEDVESDDEMLQ